METRTRTVRFNGRIVANPNRSGVVQSTIQGRYERAQRACRALGARVKAGDLMGSVTPSFASIDSSDMAQTLGDIDQEIALNRTKLARQEQLLSTNVVARGDRSTICACSSTGSKSAAVICWRPGCGQRSCARRSMASSPRRALWRGRSWRTPTSYSRSSIRPASWSRRSCSTRSIPMPSTEATATVGTDTTIKLKFIGRSRALQQQYSIMQFEIVEAQSR